MHALHLAFILFILFLASFVSTFGSSIVVGDGSATGEHFGVTLDSSSSAAPWVPSFSGH
jgi:hypothetical protein